MDKGYKNIWILFAAILAVIIIGFYKTYFSLFPHFKNVSAFQHFHTILFLLWFLLLFIQPFLIRRGKISWHRMAGKLSFILVPCLAVSIFLVTKDQYHRDLLLLPKSQCIANLLIPLPQLVLFVTLYILAMINIKHTAYHMRYIIGTSLILIGPGLGRAFIFIMGLSFSQGVQFCFVITELVLIGLIVYDIRMKNKYKPYAVLLFLFLSSHLTWYFLPQSALWQKVGGGIVDTFF